jgi:peptide methionine sulfoxide reductase MsrA
MTKELLDGVRLPGPVNNVLRTEHSSSKPRWVALCCRARCDLIYAEDCHQQYLAKNPDGYCGLKGTGVSCPIGGSVQVSSH